MAKTLAQAQTEIDALKAEIEQLKKDIAAEKDARKIIDKELSDCMLDKEKAAKDFDDEKKAALAELNEAKKKITHLEKPKFRFPSWGKR